MSTRACWTRCVVMDVGTWRSGRGGSAPRAETRGYGSGAQEGKRLWGGKPSALGSEKRIGRDT